MSVKVTHIAKSLSSEWLRSTLSQCGTVLKMELTTASGSKSAVAQFSSLEEAESAVRELDGTGINGSTMRVELVEDKEKISSSTTPQTRQVSPTPTLGQLKFGERKQSIFQSPPEDGIKIKTDESTAKTSTTFCLNLDKSLPEPPPPPVASSDPDDDDDKTSQSTALASFSFSPPKDLSLSTPSSKSEPKLSESFPSHSPSRRMTRHSHNLSIQSYRSTTARKSSQRVSPTPPVRQAQKSLSFGGQTSLKISSTLKQKEEGSKRHHPYWKKSPKRLLDSGKTKQTSSQASQSLSQSGDNPFLSNLKLEKNIPSVPSSIASTATAPPQKDFKEHCSKDILLSDEVVCQLFVKHPQVVAELKRLADTNGVTYSVEGSSIKLSGFRIDIEKCEPKITGLIQTVQQQIVSGNVPQHCMHIPFLAIPEALGQLKSISDENCVQITISTSSNEQGFVALNDFAKSYNEKYENSLLPTCDLENLTIPDVHLHSEQPPVWSYSLGGPGALAIPHNSKDSELIENAFRHGCSPTVLQYNRAFHTFNFFEREQMSQINLQTGDRFPLVRAPSLTPKDSGTCAPEYAINLLLRGAKDCIVKANEEICRLLQSVTKEYNCELPVDVGNEKTLDFLCVMLNYARRYCIALRPIEFGSKPVIKFESTTARGYGEQVRLELVKASLDLKSRILSNMTQAQTQAPLPQNPQPMYEIPKEWEEQSFDPELKDISTESLEWKQVHDEMLKTMPNVKIKRLQRIQNRQLWTKYALERSLMSERNKGEINEKGLFHGTRSSDPLAVVTSDKGIDFRHSSEDRNLWGRGAYFAVNASYSDRYSYQCKNGDKQMLLVRVLTGRSYRYEEPQRDLIKPPPLGVFSSGRCYDTVTSDTGGSQIYVVYDHDKSYASYLITYR